MSYSKAFKIVNPEASKPCLFICDHASNRIPEHLNKLGMADTDIESHAAYDIGAADITEYLANHFQATAIFCRYSRLVIDVNRWPSDPSAVPSVSEVFSIPGNQDLSPLEKDQRIEQVFLPYHQALAGEVARLESAHPQVPMFGIHSFTPVYYGEQRPWHIGVMWDDDEPFARRVIAALELVAPDIVVGANKPYDTGEIKHFTLEYHANRQNHPHVIVEVRQDLVATKESARDWAKIIAKALDHVLKQ